MKMGQIELETWLLKEPTVALSRAEREWFDWAAEAAKSVLDDDDWLADNDDALTAGGQLLDMRYRLEEQAPDVAETDATDAQLRGRKRSLASLLYKLERSGYWTESYHK